VLFPEYVTNEVTRVSFSLGYLIIVPAVLFSGMMIWIDSLVQAWRQRDLPSMGIAAWNTFAQVYNTYEAIQGIPQAFGDVMGFFSKSSSDSDDAKGAAILLIIALVVLAIVGGIIITAAIIKKYAATTPLPSRSKPIDGEYLPASRL
jgi:cellobiose-specific phosphotransferase system component IIC